MGRIRAKLDNVIRRVGGLEESKAQSVLDCGVIRRVGGLEDRGSPVRSLPHVIRRVGGLEGSRVKPMEPSHVIRRVGGLDCQKLRPHSAAGAFVLELVQGEVDADSRLSSPYGIPPSSHIGRRAHVFRGARLQHLFFPLILCARAGIRVAARHFRRWRLYAGVRGKAGSGEPELPCGLWRRLQRREHRGGPLAGQARRRGGPDRKSVV